MTYLLTLLLLFLAPDDATLAPVTNDDGSVDCSAEWYMEPAHDYYTWETCLFIYSGTYQADGANDTMSSDAHTALYRQVWADYMGDATAPTFKRWSEAVAELCGEDEPHGCAVSKSKMCGPWRECRTVTHVVVKNLSRRLLLHEVAHAIYTSYYHHPLYGMPQAGAYWATEGHTLGFRCLLLDIYYNYTGQVDGDAYQTLRGVCSAVGWN